MVPASIRTPLDRRPLAREVAVAAAIVGAFVCWIQLLWPVAGLFTSSLGPASLAESGVGSLAATALSNAAVVVAGTVAFAAGYARLRDRSLPLSLPARDALPVVGAVALAPVAAIAAVELLAGATGTSLAALTGTSYADGAGPLVPAVLTIVVLFMTLPAYVLVTHALVQRTIRSAASPGVAVGVTTLLVGTVDPTGLISSGSPLQVAAATLFAVGGIALPAYAADAVDRAWLTAFCAVPLAIFVGGVLFQSVTAVDGVAEGALELAKVGLVGAGAYAYERTDSLVPPALAYAAFVVARDAVSYLVATGALA
ncbi:hypothetical protein [Halosimplex sp. TS25]|uniref:hypothetical protein n=1 Tax=Halosimplex rarum TaxID=3396619 RepID=UPI0039E7727D